MAERCCGRDVTVFGHDEDSCSVGRRVARDLLACRAESQPGKPSVAALLAALDEHAARLTLLRSDVARLHLATIRVTDREIRAAAN